MENDRQFHVDISPTENGYFVTITEPNTVPPRHRGLHGHRVAVMTIDPNDGADLTLVGALTLAASYVERLRWKARWPDHCARCEGWGMLGATTGRPISYCPTQKGDHCPSCVGARTPRCPRCGGEEWTLKEPEGEYHVCGKCGLDPDVGHDGCPALTTDPASTARPARVTVLLRDGRAALAAPTPHEGSEMGKKWEELFAGDGASGVLDEAVVVDAGQFYRHVTKRG